MKYCDPQRVAKGLASQIWLKVGIFCDVVHCASQYTPLFKSLVSVRFLIFLLSKDALNWSKGFCNTTKDLNFK